MVNEKLWRRDEVRRREAPPNWRSANEAYQKEQTENRAAQAEEYEEEMLAEFVPDWGRGVLASPMVDDALDEFMTEETWVDPETGEQDFRSKVKGLVREKKKFGKPDRFFAVRAAATLLWGEHHFCDHSKAEVWGRRRRNRSISLLETEYLMLKWRAHEAGMSISEFVRTICGLNPRWWGECRSTHPCEDSNPYDNCWCHNRSGTPGPAKWDPPAGLVETVASAEPPPEPPLPSMTEAMIMLARLQAEEPAAGEDDD